MTRTFLSAIPVTTLVTVASGQSLFLTNSGLLQATAELPNVASNSVFLPVVQPGPGSDTATMGPMVASSAGYAFQDSPGTSRLDMTFAHNCSYTGGWSRALTYSSATFSAAAGTNYIITGVFSPPLGQRITELHLDVSLIASPGGTLFRHSTVRNVSGGSSIVLGAAIPGDTLTGSPAGAIVPGVTYTIAATMYTNNPDFVLGGITASGTLAAVLTSGPAPCYANCDGSTTAPRLNVNDYICFANKFATSDPYANCDASTTPPVLNIVDFLCFMNQYAAGCP